MKSYSSLADFYHAIGSEIPKDSEFAAHTIQALHKRYPFRSPDFRANYFSIVLVESGSGHYRLDSQEYPTKNYTVYFTNPGHIKGFELLTETQAVIITFSERFLFSASVENAFEQFPFLLAETVPPSYLSSDLFSELNQYAQLIISEYKTDNTSMTKPLLIALLNKIKQHCWHAYHPQKNEGDSSKIVKDFKQLLEDHFSQLGDSPSQRPLQVQVLAQALQLNASYLSQVIKLKTGKTVSQWMAERTLLEAEGLLKRTSHSIQEIGYHLGFSEPTHFTKFFKKHLQITPSQYRKQKN